MSNSYSASPPGATLEQVNSSLLSRLEGWYIDNPNTSMVYVQFFEGIASNITLGTTPPKLSLGIPAGSAANTDVGNGITFTNGMVIAVTTTRSGAVAPAAATDINLWFS